MRLDKFTIKSQELIQNAQAIAGHHHHQQMEPLHLLQAMLDDQEGITRSILHKMGVAPAEVTRLVSAAMDKLPQVSGGTGEVYLSQPSRTILETAFSEADKMKDQYISIEHILLVLCDPSKSPATADIFNRLGIKRDTILKVLMDIRGSQRITDPNPEEKYQALDIKAMRT